MFQQLIILYFFLNYGNKQNKRVTFKEVKIEEGKEQIFKPTVNASILDSNQELDYSVLDDIGTLDSDEENEEEDNRA